MRLTSLRDLLFEEYEKEKRKHPTLPRSVLWTIVYDNYEKNRIKRKTRKRK